jgi:hypothetical protein
MINGESRRGYSGGIFGVNIGIQCPPGGIDLASAVGYFYVAGNAYVESQPVIV